MIRGLLGHVLPAIALHVAALRQATLAAALQNDGLDHWRPDHVLLPVEEAPAKRLRGPLLGSVQLPAGQLKTQTKAVPRLGGPLWPLQQQIHYKQACPGLCFQCCEHAKTDLIHSALALAEAVLQCDAKGGCEDPWHAEVARVGLLPSSAVHYWQNS